MPLAKPLLLAAAFSALVVPAAASSFPDQASADSARRGATYLASTQGDDGAVPAESKRPDEVAEAVTALVAGGDQVSAVARAIEYLKKSAQGFAQGPGGSGPRTGRIVSGLVSAGENPRTFAGFDFVKHLESFYNPATASYGGAGDGGMSPSLYADAQAMLGVLASGDSLPELVVTRLELNQCDGGGWSHQTPCNIADTDTTALVVSVLAATTGTAGQEVRDARQWLLDTQNDSGCWGYDQANPQDNPNSCGLAMAAIVALGENPGSAPWAQGANDPSRALRAFQLESGGFKLRPVSSGANISATKQAIPGLAGWSYAIAAVSRHSDEPNASSEHPRPSSATTQPPTASGRNDNTPADASSTPPDVTNGSPSGSTTTTRVAHSRASTTATTTVASGEGSADGKTAASGTGDPRVTARLDGDSQGTRRRAAILAEFSLGLLSSVTVISAWRWRRRWKRTALGLISFGSPGSKLDDP